MGRRRSAAAATAVVALALAGAGGGALRYADPTGDGGEAPDVASVFVENDVERLEFEIRLANRAELGASDFVLLDLDVDRDEQTGREWVIVVRGTDHTYSVYRWNGTAYSSFTGDVADAAIGGSLVVVTVSRKAAGIRDALDFTVETAHGDDMAAAPWDRAPDRGAWRYDLSRQPATKVDAGVVVFAPDKPRAGRWFAVESVRLYLSNDRIVRVPHFTCRAALGGQPLGRTGSCVWRVPSSTRGQKLTVSVTAVHDPYGGAIEPYTFTIR